MILASVGGFGNKRSISASVTRGSDDDRDNPQGNPRERERCSADPKQWHPQDDEYQLSAVLVNFIRGHSFDTIFILGKFVQERS